MTRNPLDGRMVFVTGKGGAGKSTVSAALGLAAARSGRRTIVAELARRCDVRRVLGDGATPPDSVELEIAPNLYTISIDPERALEEYLIDQLPVRALAARLASSRTFTYLAAATPGLRELLAIGKAWELAQPARRTPGADSYDLVIVDAPATGHGAGFLGAPRTFAAMAAVGPIARQASKIHATLSDPQTTAVVAVATPTEPSLAEAAETRAALEPLGLAVDRLVVNGVRPARFDKREMEAIEAVFDGLDADAAAGVRGALSAAVAAHRRSSSDRSQVARARRRWGAGVVTLPELSDGSVGPAEVATLAAALGARL